MTRHSKNCTAGAFFTSAERSKLKYGTLRERIGRDSLLPVTSCHICLQTVLPDLRPVMCSQGHLFCRECILKDLLLQKQRIQQSQALAKQEIEKEERKSKLIEGFSRQHELDEFVALNSGPISHQPISVTNPTDKIPSSFWLPSKTPSASTSDDIKTASTPPCHRTMCPASKHPLERRNLMTVNWKVESTNSASNTSEMIVCGGGCERELNNLPNKLRLMCHCGHVICQKCLDITTETDFCLQCGQRLINRSTDQATKWIYVANEGSGFAAASEQLEVSKYTPSLI